jgi:indole-3-glycerol phosphate synthase
MAPTYLDDIVAFHRARVSDDTRDWRERLGTVRYEGPSMLAALSGAPTTDIKVIAEVKRRSPSKGWIDEHLDAPSLARAYELGGAAAISVLTDEPHFSGSLNDFAQVRAAVTLPLLRKDFTLSANDVLDTAAMGASAVLLIVAALDDDELALFVDVAQQCGLDALVEVHDAEELRRALDQGARLIGVNQRDLRTFEVSFERAASLVGAMPAGVTSVVESGLTTRRDVEDAARAGFDAILVGETFVRSATPQATVRSFASVARVPGA